AIHAVNFKAPTVPVYSNTTANPYPTEPAAIQQILGQHILEPVQFQQEIENIYAAGGYFFIEFGPRDILTNLVKDILGNKPYLAVALNSSRQKDSDLQLRRAVIQLRVAGFPLQDADPYQQPVRKSTRKRSMLNMRLNGSNYVNPQTKAAFEKALQDGHHIISNGVHQVEQTPAVRPVEQTPIIRPVEQPATVRQVEQPPVVRQVEQPATARQVEQPTAVRQVEQVPIVTPVQSEQVVEAVPQLQALSGVDYLRSLESVERGLEQLSNHQSSTVQVHGQYLNNQVEYTKTFFQLMQQQQGLLLGGNGRPPVTPPPGVLESLERGMLRFHEHQADTLNTHAQYLNNQADYSKNFFQIVQQQAGLLQGKSADRAASHSTAANRAISNGSGSNGSASHSNGLPASARVVERSIPASPKATPAAIAAPVEVAKVVPVETPKVVPVEVAKAAPVETPKVAPVEMAKVAPVETPKATPVTPAPVAKVVAPPAPQKAAPAQSPTLVIVAPAISVSVLSRNLLEVVSEKTGYPVEMLELEMDMEADLGIDSIKRVEILGAMQERFPELPRINPEELVELRTLGQITNHMINSLQEATVPLDAAPSVDTASVLLDAAPPVDTASVSLDAAPPVDTASVSRNLLEVVSEKTGYPVEMLELEMDMEADLGIDSIKRVEILGAMQERFPSLPRINPEELVELRTLGQITNHMINSLRGTVSLDAAPSVDTASVPLDAAPSVDIDPAFLSQNLLEVVSEKTGYPVEMLELEMDMEADLGIDSIKRVEILGAMQERFPSLPRINPEELVELRTLGQITNHMISSLRGTVSLDTAPPVDTAPDEDETVSRSLVRLKHLPPPDYLEGSLPEQYVCLLTDDGTTTTVELSQALVEQGQKVVVLSFPQSVIATCLRLPTEAKRVVLEDLSEVNLEQTLKIIAEKYGPIGGFIHLNPPSFLNQKGGIPFLDTEKDLVKQVFLIAKHLKKSLNDAARKGRSCFFTVARLDGQFGLGQTNSFGAIAGGLFGLTKTLNLEWERVFCRALDLSPDLDASLAAKHILAELHDPNRLLGEVAYNLEGRSTLIGEKVLVGGRDR
ncbi:MAG: phosphopantetheine-binding protein, partial [Chloroflexota bacterium]